MQEIWKDVKGFEGYYKVSNLGNVKSLNRVIRYRNGRLKPIKERVLYKNTSRGYYNSTLSKNGISYMFQNHILVANAFIPKIKNKPEINHKNSIRIDNKVGNLEWCTHAENMAHAGKNVLMINPITNKVICEYPSVSEASRSIKTDRHNIIRCCANYKYKAAGYKWKFKP